MVNNSKNKESKSMKYYHTIIIALLFQGCATQNMLPQHVSDVNFSAPEGKTGWSQYQQVEKYQGYTSDQIFDAAKVGLGVAGFSIITADKNKGLVIGEHGITLHDWNVLAGVYFKSEGDNTNVRIIVEGSKDVGFSGDVTGDGWIGKIIKGMRDYLNQTYQAILKVDKSDLK